MDNFIHRLQKELQSGEFEEEYINLVVRCAEKLLENKVLVIFDLNHLSLYLEISPDKISSMIQNSFLLYKEVKIKKKNGLHRVIHIPSKELKKIQKFILENILYSIGCSIAATGFKRDSSIKDNAIRHVNNKYILNLDLIDFFTNIKFEKIKKVFKDIGYNEDVSNILANLCTVKGFLPQGASSSPYLSNLVCRKLDNVLSDFANRNQLNYTRYADDITFSSDNESIKDIKKIYDLIISEGFKINEKKTRLLSSNKRQEVTGLVVNNKVNINRDYIKKLRSEIYFCLKFGVNGHMSRKGITYSNYKNYLYGKAYYIKMINKEKGENFLKDLDKINWEY